jgi:hypothetical protein
MRENNNGGVPLFGPNGNHIPIVGQPAQPEQPVLLGMQTYITKQMKEKLDGYAEKTGLPPGEIGATIIRLGLCAFSMMIDKENENITNPEYYLPPNGQTEES